MQRKCNTFYIQYIRSISLHGALRSQCENRARRHLEDWNVSCFQVSVTTSSRTKLLKIAGKFYCRLLTHCKALEKRAAKSIIPYLLLYTKASSRQNLCTCSCSFFSKTWYNKKAEVYIAVCSTYNFATAWLLAHEEAELNSARSSSITLLPCFRQYEVDAASLSQICSSWSSFRLFSLQL